MLVGELRRDRMKEERCYISTCKAGPVSIDPYKSSILGILGE